jgi:replicative DNA helicase
MLGNDAFGPDFQRQLVRGCMGDAALRGIVARFIRAGQLGWTDPGAAFVWRLIEARDHVSPLMLQTEAARLDAADPARIGAHIVATGASDFRDAAYVRERIVEWAKRQVFRQAFEESRAAYTKGDIDGAMKQMLGRIEEANAMDIGVADRGWFFEELHERQRERFSAGLTADAFPSGIAGLDEAMNGGLRIGELEIPLAYSGIGKTFWCVQRGYVATRLYRRVLHLPLEGGRQQTQDRYEARFAQTMFSVVRGGDISPEVLARLDQDYQNLRQNLVIRSWNDGDRAWAVNFDDIVTELKTLRRDFGWVPELIVVDYGDLLAEKGDNEYERQKLAYRKLKSLSERIEFPGHHGYAVCSPSQAQRPDKGADTREHVLRPRDIADSYEKVRVADVVVSLNRTMAEKEHKSARVHLGKYRHAEDGGTWRVETEYQFGAFSKLYAADPGPPPPRLGKAP